MSDKPTLDERMQIWSALHLRTALILMAVGLLALGWWAFR